MLDPNSDEFTQEREVVRAKSPPELLQPLLPFQVRAQKAAVGGVVVVDGNGKLLALLLTSWLLLLLLQEEGVGWMLGQEASVIKGGILADEMGMGKTIQTIGLLLAAKRRDVLGTLIT